MNGVCAGAVQSPNYNGYPCNSVADCADGDAAHSGTSCSNLAECTAAGETNGCARWVGRPRTFMERQGPPATGPYRAARLQCTPFYNDWKSEPKFCVFGAEIMPSSTYSVQAYSSNCMGNEATCTSVSAPVTMYTRRCGDIASVYNPPDLSKQPDAIDIAKIVDSFKGLSTGLPKCISKITPNLPEHNLNVDAGDISQVVDQAKGFAYRNPPYDGPCPCPSAVPCGVACNAPACTANPRNTCVTTCTGGPNNGEPCLNGRHCGNTCPGPSRPGLPCKDNADFLGETCTIVGVCGNPSCRDACGRCKP
jgi:hypothetical protein